MKFIKKYGEYYLLQDNELKDNTFDIKIIKTKYKNIQLYTENNGKIWKVKDTINLINCDNKRSR